MTGIKLKFVSIKFSNIYSSIKIADGIQSPILGNEVVQVTPLLILIDVMYALKFSISLLSISQYTKHNNYKIIFSSSHCVFQDLSTGGRIGSGHEKEGMYYLDD